MPLRRWTTYVCSISNEPQSVRQGLRRRAQLTGQVLGSGMLWRVECRKPIYILSCQLARRRRANVAFGVDRNVAAWAHAGSADAQDAWRLTLAFCGGSAVVDQDISVVGVDVEVVVVVAGDR